MSSPDGMAAVVPPSNGRMSCIAVAVAAASTAHTTVFLVKSVVFESMATKRFGTAVGADARHAVGDDHFPPAVITSGMHDTSVRTPCAHASGAPSSALHATMSASTSTSVSLPLGSCQVGACGARARGSKSGSAVAKFGARGPTPRMKMKHRRDRERWTRSPREPDARGMRTHHRAHQHADGQLPPIAASNWLPAEGAPP